MSLKKLTKRLRREATANPKKAAILGLLAVVALYFWAPLLKGMLVKEEKAAKSSLELPEDLSSAGLGFPTMGQAQAAVAAAGSETLREECWEDVVGRLDGDRSSRSAEDLAQRRSPFHAACGEVVETDVEAEPVEAVPTPETLGMQLTGTVVGAGRRVALIDVRAFARDGGVKTVTRAFTRGKSVGTLKDEQAIDFTLAEVHPERIVLERLGVRYELAVPVQAAAGRIELMRNGD